MKEEHSRVKGRRAVSLKVCSGEVTFNQDPNDVGKQAHGLHMPGRGVRQSPGPGWQGSLHDTFAEQQEPLCLEEGAKGWWQVTGEVAAEAGRACGACQPW